MTTQTIKQNDLEPPLRMTLVDRDGARVDLTNAEFVRFIMARRGVNKVDREIDVIADQGVGNEETWGDIELHWQAGETDTRGEYSVEVEVTWPGDRPQTFPESGYERIRIVRDLG